jgi:hypothetical protein
MGHELIDVGGRIDLQGKKADHHFIPGLFAEADDGGGVGIVRVVGGAIEGSVNFQPRPDRWRPVNADSVAGVQELLIKGHRVLAERHQMIGPTSETIRYTANRRLGYHGGLTEQECIAPLAGK